MHRILVATLGSMILSGCTFYDVEPSSAALLLPRLSAEEAAAVPEGARVEIDRRFTNTDTHATTSGVVLKASSEGLALANCTVAGTTTYGTPIMNKVPYVSRMFKNTGIPPQQVPVLWLPLDQISAVHVLEPPPADYVPPSIEISTAQPERIGVDFDYATAHAERSPAALR